MFDGLHVALTISLLFLFFFFKQKTAYEMRISDWSSDVCSSDLFLTTILIAIDITLAGLFWAMDGESNIFGRLIKKILYVGVFALILNNFSMLADRKSVV